MSGDDKKKVDPGWNDPPTLNYSSSNPPPKSRIGNKRIAFPLSSNQNVSQNSTSSTVPPMSPLRPPSVRRARAEELLKLTLENLADDLSTIKDPQGTIKSKLDLMKDLWLDNRLDVDIQRDIYNLSRGMAIRAIDEHMVRQLGVLRQIPVCCIWIDVFDDIIFSLKPLTKKPIKENT